MAFGILRALVSDTQYVFEAQYHPVVFFLRRNVLSHDMFDLQHEPGVPAFAVDL